MTNITINPMQQCNFDHLEKFPGAWILPINRPPRIFTDGNPTPDDRELALALWRELDLDSRRWYVGWHLFRKSPEHIYTLQGIPLQPEDLALLTE